MAVINNYFEELETLVTGKNLHIGSFNRIGKNVKIGNNVTIGDHCSIQDNVQIGDNTVVENFVLLKENTIIGSNTFIDSYVRSSGNNLIGNNVTIRYGATIAREVTIKDNVFISPNVMTIYLSHERKSMLGTVIEENAFIGTASVIGGGVKIGRNVIIGAMAYVSKDCIEIGTYAGVPARLMTKKQ